MFRYSIHTLKSQFDIKEKYRNSFKLRYLQNFEVFSESYSRVLHAEREGFEPPEALTSTVFKTAAIDHSAISPRNNENFPFSFPTAKVILIFYYANIFAVFLKNIFRLVWGGGLGVLSSPLVGFLRDNGRFP